MTRTISRGLNIDHKNTQCVNVVQLGTSVNVANLSFVPKNVFIKTMQN